MIRIIYIFALMLAFSVFNYGEPKANSLAVNTLSAQDNNDSEKDSLLDWNEKIISQRFSDPALALKYGQKALSLNSAIENIPVLSRIHTNMGFVYSDLARYDKALDAFSSALGICSKRANHHLWGNCLNNIGKVYLKLGIYTLALKNFEQAEDLFREGGYLGGLARSYNNIAMMYCMTGNFDRAIQYLNDVLDLPDDSITKIMQAKTFMNIGDLYSHRGSFQLSQDFYTLAKNIYAAQNDKRAIALVHRSLGDLLRESHDIDAALIEYGTALKIFKELNSQKALGETLLSHVGIFIDMGQTEMAKQYANQAISIANKYGFLEIQKEAYYLLSAIYVSTDELLSALDYYNEYSIIKDSIFNENVTHSIAAAETRTTFSQYEINVDQIEDDRQSQRYTRWFVIIILILALLTVILAYSRLFSQRKANRILAHQRNILKKTLSEQRISEEKYKALFDQANDAIFLMDHETFKDCNDKTLEMFGCKREEIVGHPPYDFSPELQPDGQSSKEKAIKIIELCYEGKPQSFYWMHTKKDGTPFDAEVSLNMINLEGDLYVQAIVRNISERVRAEKEMIQAREKAEKATESKTFFLAKMSHEIRTMLGGITSSAQLLEKTKVDDYQSELLQIINNSADDLLLIVNEILDLSKIEAGKIELENSPFSIKKSVEEIVSAYSQKARDKKISLFLSLHPKIPDFVYGDKLRLKQILTNLLSNAIKFTNEGSVSLDVILNKDTENHIEFTFSVADTGIGIPSHKINDLFSEYSQSEVSTSRRYGGTGLGLNIAYRLVTLMGGSIEAQSELNTGSQFNITLSFEKATEPQQNDDPGTLKTPISSKKYSILLAEDNVANQKLTMINLQNYGHRADHAENGKVAWEKYQENEYDIILMDIQMPEMDGVEATRMIRKYEKENPSRRRTRIIALTANVFVQDQQYYSSIGMDDFISKPFKIEDILIKLDA
jgi:PAS domain S-box-containing protein